MQAKNCDPYIDNVIPVLLKRATDTNFFISEAAEAALVAIG